MEIDKISQDRYIMNESECKTNKIIINFISHCKPVWKVGKDFPVGTYPRH